MTTTDETQTDETLAKKKERVAKRDAWFGYVFIFVAVLMVAHGAWTQYDREGEVTCQSNFNQRVAEDRAELNEMIFKIMDPKSSDAARELAVQEYIRNAQTSPTAIPNCD